MTCQAIHPMFGACQLAHDHLQMHQCDKALTVGDHRYLTRIQWLAPTEVS